MSPGSWIFRCLYYASRKRRKLSQPGYDLEGEQNRRMKVLSPLESQCCESGALRGDHAEVRAAVRGG